ncbi:NAD(+) diphosphatase [Microbacterium sp. LRZ72]|uniref:NAD(+) diphosphatase n=1 Tax=Microbacterium sp. LRZ72 TaxID=2942481 RepID=UPI0029A101F6|nr:NAD(+) diphosphatase [Microbacterium sp. LRZ72]MDX2375737.1 NAD(+) diphosphatase [Microbacterium sp. LRZ72]
MSTLRAPGAPAVSEPTWHRSAHERDESDLIPRLRADSGMRLLVVHHGRAPLAQDGDRLHLLGGDAIDDGDLLAFLGRSTDGDAVVLAVRDDDADVPEAPGGWNDLRTHAGGLAAPDGELAVEAQALARWLREAPFCGACGTRCELGQSGWSRRCPACLREHFPRTDPAVIAAVTDGDRLLLGSNAAWPAGRFSCFAGFIEAGESAEQTLVRELEEEAGIRVASAEYIGSQAWPYPRSLMLGYLAHVDPAHTARADGEEIVEVRWFDHAEIGAALAGRGEVTLPGAASISRSLIELWHARAEEAP